MGNQDRTLVFCLMEIMGSPVLKAKIDTNILIMKVFLQWVTTFAHLAENAVTKIAERKRARRKPSVAGTMYSVTAPELLREMQTEAIRQLVWCAFEINV